MVIDLFLSNVKILNSVNDGVENFNILIGRKKVNKAEIKIESLKKAIKKLSLKDREKLLESLRRDNATKQWNYILKNIDRRLKNSPISQQEINEEIIAYHESKKGHA